MRLAVLLAAAAAAFVPASARAAWHEATSRHFVIYSDTSPEQLQAFATKLERFDKALRVLNGLTDPPVGHGNRLTVFVLDDLRDISKLVGGDENVAGFYVGRATGALAFVPRRTHGQNRFALQPDAVFFHEYAHHMMLGSSHSVAPAWYTEGFAEFFSTAKFEKNGDIGLGYPAMHRAYGLVGMRPIATTRLLTGFPDRASPADMESFYARGWLLTHYLTFEPSRKGQLTAYLQKINGGRTSLDAAKESFGDIEALDRELTAYQRRKRLSYFPISADRVPATPVRVRALGKAEAAILPTRMRSKRGVDEAMARKLVAEARKVAAQYPADPLVQVTLAECEHDAGNWDAAEAAADRVLAADPRHAEAMIYKGRARTRRLAEAKSTDAAAWRDARRWFSQANRADPEDPEPLVLFYESFQMSGAKPTANAEAGLAYALDLAPQDMALRMEMAGVHLRNGKVPEARRALTPVALSAHGGAIAKAATEILASLNGSGAPEALKTWQSKRAASTS